MKIHEIRSVSISPATFALGFGICHLMKCQLPTPGEIPAIYFGQQIALLVVAAVVMYDNKMGAVLAKFRRKKTTYEVLEQLEQNIQDIEEYSVSTQAQQKRYVGNLLVISIGLYVIGFLVFYFLFFPPTWMERITYSVPLLIFPMLIFFLKRLVAWYFQRKLNKNNNKLTKLKTEKKKAIEKVMENETYKVALEILNRFGDKSNGLKPTGAITPRVSSSPTSAQKSLISAKQLSGSASQLSQLQGSPIRPVTNLSAGFGTPTRTPSGMHGAPGVNQLLRKDQQVPRLRTPYPIINQQAKGVLEKMVDYLIGDGPQNRFAMICKECYAHNGMALQEEYEYAAFRCAFCNAMNPSRKSRPVAPRLPASPIHAALTDVSLKRSESSSSSSSGEKDSGSDSEEDRKDENVAPQQDFNPGVEEENIEEAEQVPAVEAKTEEEKKND